MNLFRTEHSSQASRRLLILLLVVLMPSVAPAEITFDQDFDSGSLDTANTSVDYTDPSSPVVTLAPRRTWSNQYWWVAFKASGLAGLTPEFRITTAGVHLGYDNSNRWAYSATPGDINSWSFFDNGHIEQGDFVSSNNNPFAEDALYIAYGLPYPVSRTASHTASLIGNPFVSPTHSGDASFVIGQTLGTAGGGYTDDVGRLVPAQDLYGYKITNPASTVPKSKIVTTTGNHAGETSGTWAHQGFVDFVLSDDPAALQLRELAEIYVYPQSDPEGRYMGYFRSTPQNPVDNHNRRWNDPFGSTELETITSAMIADTEGQVDFFLDFHSISNGTEYYLHEENPWTTATIDNLARLEPTVEFRGRSGASWAAGFGSETLKAEVSLTPEIGYLGIQPVSRYLTYGENYARAILQTIRQPPEPLIPRPRSESVFLQKVNALKPELHLRFSETGIAEGQQALDAANNHHGTYQGSLTLGSEDPFDLTSGVAAKFEGSFDSTPGEYVRVPDFDYTNVNNEFSIAFWFRSDVAIGPGAQSMFSHGTWGQPHYIEIKLLESISGSPNRIVTNIIDENDPTDSGGPRAVVPDDGEWHFYTLTVSPEGGANVYIDGILEEGGPQGGDAFDPSGEISIGGDVYIDSFYCAPDANKGLFDELMIFNFAMNSEDIRQLYLSPAVPEPSTALVASLGIGLSCVVRRRLA